MATLGFQGEEVKALQEKVEFLKTSEEAKDYEIKKTKVLLVAVFLIQIQLDPFHETDPVSKKSTKITRISYNF